MKVGFGIPNNHGVEDPNDLVALAVTAERLGYASVWVREHLYHSTYVAERLGDRPYHDALTVLTAIACSTRQVRLGTSVLVLPWHHPARLGKMVATLDHLSGGRVALGVGVAITEDEFENLGVDFKTRGKLMDETLEALKALWTEDIPSYSGEFHRFGGLRFSPKPKQSPHPPLLIGGGSAAARRRVARLGDGWHTLRLTPAQFDAGRRDIIARCRAAGRDASEPHFSITLPMGFTGKAPSAPVMDRTALTGTDGDIAETVRAYRDVGVDEIVVSVSTGDLAENNAAMEHFMDRVWPRVDV